MHNRKSKIENRKSQKGLSLIELLISLVITAMLLTATMVAIDASFAAYAAAAESASTQTTTRLVTHRLLSMIRTSTAHGPLEATPSPTADWITAQDALDAALQAAHGIDAPAKSITEDGDMILSNYIELYDSRNRYIVIEYISSLNEIWVIAVDVDGNATAQPLLGGVSDATFFAKRRLDADGVLVLERASLDMTILADDDNSLELEAGSQSEIRVVASTMPRRLD